MLAWLLLLAAAGPDGQDWPQWRGAARDGVWRETGITESFKDGRLPVKWSVPLGGGYSGPTVADGRVYVMDRVTEPKSTERVHCVDWKTGETIWMKSAEVAYEGFTYPAGPRASVTVHDGLAYALGSAGNLHCYDAATGTLKWKRDLRTEHGIRMPNWGIAASPLIVDDALITQIDGKDDACVVALDRKTGRDLWTALPDRAAYAAPIAVEQAGRMVVVLCVADRVVGLDPADGGVLWSYGMPGSKWPITISTPVVEKDLLFITTAHVGAALLRLKTDAPEIEEVWRRNARVSKNNDTLHSVIPTPLVMNGHIFGVHSRGELRCLDLMTGKHRWDDTRANPLDRHSTMHIVRQGEEGDRAWLFNDVGELILARLTGKGYEEIARARLIEPTRLQLKRGVTWAHPAFAYRHVFARSDKELLCADLSAK